MSRARCNAATEAVVRVAIYTRISEDEFGTQLGVDRQEAETRQRLDAEYGPDGYVVTRVYSDNGISAWSGARRPEYEELKRDARADLFDVLAVWATDRLYRRVVDLADVVDVLGTDPRTGIALVAKVGSFYDLTTADGRYYATMDAARAQHESDRKSERVRSQIRQGAALGWPTTPTPGYGYRWESWGRQQGGTYRIVEAEAEVIRQAAAMLLDDDDPLSQGAVADVLNAAGVTNRAGQPWTGKAIRKILGKPVLVGVQVVDGEEVDGNWEPILERDVWDDIQAELSDPKRRKRRKRGDYWLRGVLVDAGGHELVGTRLGAKGSGYGRRAYRSPAGCGCVGPNGTPAVVTVDADAVEALAVDLVGVNADRLSWEPVSGAPSREATRIVELQARLDDLFVERERDPEMTAREYRRRRAELQAQLVEARAAAPPRVRAVPMVSSDDLSQRWCLPESKGGISAAHRRDITRWALRRVIVAPSGGGRFAAQPDRLLERLSFAGDGPLAAARAGGPGPARRGRGRPSARRGRAGDSMLSGASGTRRRSRSAR